MPFVRWSAIRVGYYPLGRRFCPLGRQFCPLGAFFNGAAFIAAFF
jgi:hypothetical protein